MLQDPIITIIIIIIIIIIGKCLLSHLSTTHSFIKYVLTLSSRIPPSEKPPKIAHIVKKASGEIFQSETYSRMPTARCRHAQLLPTFSKWGSDWKGLKIGKNM